MCMAWASLFIIEYNQNHHALKYETFTGIDVGLFCKQTLFPEMLQSWDIIEISIHFFFGKYFVLRDYIFLIL